MRLFESKEFARTSPSASILKDFAKSQCAPIPAPATCGRVLLVSGRVPAASPDAANHPNRLLRSSDLRDYLPSAVRSSKQPLVSAQSFVPAFDSASDYFNLHLQGFEICMTESSPRARGNVSL